MSGDWLLCNPEADLRQARNPATPLWLRVWHAACANVDFGGVAEVDDLALLLTPLTEEGELLEPPHTKSVSRAIRQAINHGLLAEGSSRNRLVVPDRRRATSEEADAING